MSPDQRPPSTPGTLSAPPDAVTAEAAAEVVGSRYPQPRDRAVWQVREFVQRTAVTVFGAGEVYAPIFEGFAARGPTLTDPLAGVRAARLVADVAAGALRSWALLARGAGHDWADLAVALDLPTLDDQTGEPSDGLGDAEAAWEWLVENRPPAPEPGSGLAASAVWRCTTCRARVRDSGPFASHPDDREHGHTAGCARHRADIAAWHHDLEHDQHEHDEHDDEQDPDRDGRDRDGGGGGRW